MPMFRPQLLCPLIVALVAGCVPYEVSLSIPCVDGTAKGFGCSNVDLAAHLPPEQFDATRGNDLWGWTDPDTGSEVVLAGMYEGLGVVDATVPTAPVVLGNLPSTSGRNVWRDTQVVDGHAYVVSEEPNHGMQILALAPLLGVPTGQLTEDRHYWGFLTAHNLVSLASSRLLFAVGSDQCNAGMHGMDVSDPLKPVFLGCWEEAGYVHDAQCVTYEGPDSEHVGKDICIAFTPEDENGVYVIDMSDPTHPRTLGAVAYPDQAYSHQGWLTADQTHVLMNDEADGGPGIRTRTLFIDVRDLDQPKFVGAWRDATTATTHDEYIVGGLVYQANYAAGLRILEIGDPASASLREVGFFDTVPTLSGPEMKGAWGTYPFFASGTVAVTSFREGLMLLTPTLASP